MGDFNAKVGEDRIGNTAGPYGLGKINERGERLVEWCQTHDLVVCNTWFEQPARRKWTWKSPGDGSRNQIDYILTNERFRNAIKSAKTYPGADCYSDHVPVVAKLNLKLKKTSSNPTNIKLDLALLKTNQLIREKYQVSVQNKFESLGEAEEIEKQWENFKEAITLAAKQKKYQELKGSINKSG
ncbi:craniofacial development protein 2-like protein [Plakobranchus ocellatus]|uniref:Craniofacial development protein 2-like protein n=1 Tax=Plakobranchus ocellatus TaxID=259542 RepID=A0AAV3Y2G2_9GAST|nr:craniofacial development protein 2-like protein [Plakobranchus ocellatus]